jgi:hypothetical protein
VIVVSWAFCTTKHVKKTRKPHRCEFCGRIIPAGTLNILNWAGLYDGDFQNSYACHWCEEHQSQLVDDWDNEILDFWDCLKGDIFWKELEPYRPVYGETNGDYFVFKSFETDKEMWRVKCPICK